MAHGAVLKSWSNIIRKKRQSGSRGDKMFGKQKTLMKTMTGEHYMLARVHFKVRDKIKVLRTFSRLKCIEFDPQQKRWSL